MLSLLRKKIKVAVHSGKFHPDDVCAVAILSLCLKRPIQVFRTRDPKVWADMDYVFDVGGEYDPKVNIFDHHQEGWNMKRENGITYSSAGLAWKHFGEQITGSHDIAQKIDEKIIQPIDAEDNGIELHKNNFEDVSAYTFGDYLFAFNPTWMEEKEDSLKGFMTAVHEAKKMFEREIKRAKDNITAIDFVKDIYEKTEDKRIIILDTDYSWRKTLMNYPEPLFVISPRPDNGTWAVATVDKLHGSKFERKMLFPESWAGKRDDEFAKITGVADATFCHNGRFIAGARSKEGAIALAKLALK